MRHSYERQGQKDILVRVRPRSEVWSFLRCRPGPNKGLSAEGAGSTFFVVLPNYAFNLSATGWGWVHLILGVLVDGAFGVANRAIRKRWGLT